MVEGIENISTNLQNEISPGNIIIEAEDIRYIKIGEIENRKHYKIPTAKLENVMY